MSVFPSVVSSSPLSTPGDDDIFSPAPAPLVLLIDDDDLIADVVERVLVREGKRVKRARNGMDGAQYFAAFQGAISLVILDCCLPDMNGIALYRILRKRAPALPIILTSGFAIDATLEGPTVFLPKPFFTAQVKELVTELLGATA